MVQRRQSVFHRQLVEVEDAPQDLRLFGIGMIEIDPHRDFAVRLQPRRIDRIDQRGFVVLVPVDREQSLSRPGGLPPLGPPYAVARGRGPRRAYCARWGGGGPVPRSAPAGAPLARVIPYAARATSTTLSLRAA